MLVVTELLNIAVNDFGVEKYGRPNRLLFLTELVIFGTRCISFSNETILVAFRKQCTFLQKMILQCNFFRKFELIRFRCKFSKENGIRNISCVLYMRMPIEFEEENI